MPSVIVEPWVHADIFHAVRGDRALLGRILLELQHHLPANLPQYQTRRIINSPRCFWYERDYSLDVHSFQLRRLRFVVQDSAPSLLKIIWVIVAQ